MTLVADFYRSTIGKKVVMAVTGLALVGFVIGHMLGNLKVFTGVDPASGLHRFDLYAVHLREIGADFFGHSTLLWLARGGLLLAVVLHIWSAVSLSILNGRAKPVTARSPRYDSSNAASRTMKWGGLFLFVFIIYHLLHFTTGTVHFRGFEEGHVYANVVAGFQSIPIAVFYVVAMFALCMHLYHGVWSMFQTLGVTSPAWNQGYRRAAQVVAIVLFLGFSAIPVAVAGGVLTPVARTAPAPVSPAH